MTLPPSNGERPTPGRLSTTLSGSPSVPGTRLASSTGTVTRPGSRRRAGPWTVTSTGAGSSADAGGGAPARSSPAAAARRRSRHVEGERQDTGSPVVWHLRVDLARLPRSAPEELAPEADLDHPVRERLV